MDAFSTVAGEAIPGEVEFTPEAAGERRESLKRGFDLHSLHALHDNFMTTYNRPRKKQTLGIPGILHPLAQLTSAVAQHGFQLLH